LEKKFILLVPWAFLTPQKLRPQREVLTRSVFLEKQKPEEKSD